MPAQNEEYDKEFQLRMDEAEQLVASKGFTNILRVYMNTDKTCILRASLGIIRNNDIEVDINKNIRYMREGSGDWVYIKDPVPPPPEEDVIV